MQPEAANQWEPNGINTATHKCTASGNYYREPGSGAAVKWLLWCEGETMRGWVGRDPENMHTLIRLQ